MVLLFDSLNTRREEEKGIVQALLNQHPAIFKHEINYNLNDLNKYEVIIFHDKPTDVKNGYNGKKWLIEYSGSIQLQYINEEKYGSIPAEKLFSNLNEFLKHISTIQSNIQKEDFDVLYNFDPVLEAKLNLLHHCLTPDGIVEAKNTYDDLIKLLKDDNEKKEIASAFEKMEGAMGIKDVKCMEDEDVNGFPSGYVGTLETLRKSLLE